MSDIKTLTGIDVESGMAMDDPKSYRGFLKIQATSEEGDVLVGQLNPEEVRGMALAWLEAAEAADQDRIVMTMLTRDIGLEPPVAAGFISAMRKERNRKAEPEDTTYDFVSPNNRVPGEGNQEEKND